MHIAFDEDTHQSRQPKPAHIKECTSETCTHRSLFNLTGIAPGSVRKNLAVHVSLSSYLQCQKSDPSPSPADTSTEVVPPHSFRKARFSVRRTGRSSAL